MNICILGSDGQIGEPLTKYLKSKNYNVIEFDILKDKNHDLTIIPNLYLKSVIKESDFIFFLAFDVGGSKYLNQHQNTFNFINNNTKLMANTFTMIKKYNKKFVFASSQMSNMFHSPYGILKHLGELYTKSLNGLIVKFWNVYGIEKDKNKSHVITDFIRMGFDNGIIQMQTNGEEERDFLYVQDCCEALEIVMLNYDNFSSEDNLHITGFNYIKIVDIAKIISNKFKKEGNIINIKKSNHKDNIQSNSKNIADTYILNWWKPKTNIEDGIQKIFDAIGKEYKF